MNVEELKELVRCFDSSESIYMEVRKQDMSLILKKVDSGLEALAMHALTGQESEAKKGPLNAAAGQKTEAKGKLVSDKDGLKDEENEEKTLVKAPLVGVFYAASSPEAEAYVQVGSLVKKGQVLCLIEAMKMMSEVTAPVDGRIEKIYVKNADLVEFDQPLFLIGD